MKKPTLKELTLREKIGQTCVMMTMFSKGDPEYFKKNPYGGVWSPRWMMGDQRVINDFVAQGYDIGDLSSYSATYAKWLKDVNKNLTVPIISPLDAEVGMASGVPGCTSTVSASCIGSANDENLTFQIGKNVGDEAFAAGCNWIWGPVADNPSMMCGVMVSRSYSYDVDHISRMLCAQLRGIQSAGVAATAKHFPGADRHEYRDAHLQPSCINYTLEEWEKYQAPSFQAAIDAGVYSIMVAHSSFPAVDDRMEDGTYIPCTLSYKVITELLKEKMGFNGVVITDGINMRGLTAFYTKKELYVELLRAGNDMILGPEYDDYIDSVEEAVLEGLLPESRIDDACQRVLDMKERLGMFKDDLNLGSGLTQELLDATRATNKALARKGMTLLADKNKQLPLNPEKIKKVVILYDGYSDAVFENLKFMVDEFARHGAKAEFRRGIKGPNDMQTVADENDLIIYSSFITAHIPMGMPMFSGEACNPFKFILTAGKEKSIGVSLGYPFMYYNYYLNCPVFINTFGSSRESMEEFVKSLYGEFEFKTTSPFPIKPEF